MLRNLCAKFTVASFTGLYGNRYGIIAVLLREFITMAKLR